MHTVRPVKSNEYYEKKEFKVEKRKAKGKDSPYYESYYAEAGKAIGVWEAEGCEELGLLGLPCYEGELARLQAGYHPKTGEQLFKVRKTRTDKEGKTKAVNWHYMDNCFSAVKDFSMLMQLDKENTHIYHEIFEQAMNWSIKKMQSLSYSRKTINGKTGKQKIKLIVVRYNHETSRSAEEDSIPDMQFHAHTLIFKMGILDNGKFGTVENKWMLDNSKLVGTGFRAKLANGLRDRLKFRIKPHKEKFQKEDEGSKSKSVIANAFGIIGISDSVRDNFSKRSQQILKSAEEAGIIDSVEKGYLAQKGKLAKKEFTKEELMKSWIKAATDLGLTNEYIQTLKTYDEKSILDNIRTEHQIIKDSYSYKKNKQTGIINKTLYERNIRLKCFEYEQYTGIDGDKMFKCLVDNKLIEREKGFIYKSNINLDLLLVFKRNLRNRITSNSKDVIRKLVSNFKEVTFTINDLIIERKVDLPVEEIKKKVQTVQF